MSFLGRFIAGIGLCAMLVDTGSTVVRADDSSATPSPTATIDIAVRDALGRPVSEAVITLQAPDGKTISEGTTAKDGAATFGISPGTYEAKVNKGGFRPAVAALSAQLGARSTVSITVSADEALDLQVTAERLNKAQNGLSPKTGGSVYRFDAQELAKLPQGENTAFNEVLLQAPGVANDSYGQLHIRGDHANLQYRINGLILPEGITGFGQALDTRFADRIELLTGALPAQYGYRTAGVIEIQTKSAYEAGGRVDLYGGSHNTVNPSFEYGATSGPLSYYLTGSFLSGNLGIENPTASSNPIHDHTQQTKGFAYLSYLLNETSRLAAIVGTYDGHFEIPNNPDQITNPQFTGGLGINEFNSANLNETQREVNRYGILAFQSSAGPDLDYQIGVFTRYTSVSFNPDILGDLAFNGVAAQIFRSSQSNGVQGDASYRLNDRHTIRFGLFGSSENIASDNHSTVFPVDANGNVNGAAEVINDSNPKNGNTLLGIYIQDEWHATDTLTVNYGLRADKINAFVANSQLSPRLGAIYRLGPDTQLHAGYARYFTPPPTELVAPKTLSLFQNTTNDPGTTLDSPVKPERADYYDIGLTHQLTPTVNLGIDGYYKDVRDMIDEGQFGQALIFTPFNYAKGKVYGIELTGTYRRDAVSAYANLAYARAMGKQIVSSEFNFGSDELAYIASNYVHLDHDQQWTGSAGASYKFAQAELSLSAIYGSGLRSGFVNSDHLPSYIRFDLGAKQNFNITNFGKFEGRLALINVFDKSYEIRDGSGIGVGAPQFGPRRAVYVGFAKPF